MKKILLESYSWQQAQRNYVDTGKIDKYDYDELLQIARILNANDVCRLCEFYIECKNITKIKDAYNSFNEGINKNLILGSAKDIYNKKIYTNFDKFEENMDCIAYQIELLCRKIKDINSKNVENESNCIFENKDWQVFEIFGFDASRYYGNETRWCISTNSLEGQMRWEDWDQSHNIYMMIAKNRNDVFKKIAVMISKQGDMEFVDTYDNEIDIRKVEAIINFNLNDVVW